MSALLICFLSLKQAVSLVPFELRVALWPNDGASVQHGAACAESCKEDQREEVNANRADLCCHRWWWACFWAGRSKPGCLRCRRKRDVG